MKRMILLVLILFLLVPLVVGQKEINSETVGYWIKAIHSPYFENFTGITVDQDKILVTGDTDLFAKTLTVQEYQPFVFKLNKEGEILNTLCVLKNTGSYNLGPVIQGIIPTDDGYFIGGQDNEAVYILKTDKNLKVMWTKAFRLSLVRPNRLRIIEMIGVEKGIIMAVDFSFRGVWQTLLFKIDENGRILWKKVLLYSSETRFWPNAIKIFNNFVILVGNVCCKEKYPFILKINPTDGKIEKSLILIIKGQGGDIDLSDFEIAEDEIVIVGSISKVFEGDTRSFGFVSRLGFDDFKLRGFDVYKDAYEDKKSDLVFEEMSLIDDELIIIGEEMWGMEGYILKFKNGEIEKAKVWDPTLGTGNNSMSWSSVYPFEGGYIFSSWSAIQEDSKILPKEYPNDIVLAKVDKNLEIRGCQEFLKPRTIRKCNPIEIGDIEVKEMPLKEENIELPPIEPNLKFKTLEELEKEIPSVKGLFRILSLCEWSGKYLIQTKTSFGGTISPSGEVEVNVGESITFNINPNSCYRIKDVLIDGISVGPVSSCTFENVDKDHSLEAKFELKRFVISTSVTEGGKITPNRWEANCGDTVTFEISPWIGYRIKDVLVDGISVGPVTSYTFTDIQADHKIEASLEKIQFQIIASSSGGGTISPSGTVIVDYGTSKLFTFIPDTCYQVKDVLVDGVVVSTGPVTGYTIVNVQADHRLEVVFNKIKYQITTSNTYGGTISPSGTVLVDCGSSQSFRITPLAGYYLKDLLIDGISVGPVSSYTFTNIQADHKLEAIFEKKIVLELKIGSRTMTVNGTETQIDVPPQIVEGRTLLPIRLVAEPLGAEVGWDGVERKVTVSLKDTKIELWIGKSIARVNGFNTLIDPINPKVVPMIISGRTMLPVRFIAENLGCKVDWDSNTRTVTITYPKG